MEWMKLGYALASIIIDSWVFSFLQHHLFSGPLEFSEAIREEFVPDWLSVVFDEYQDHRRLRLKLGVIILALVLLAFGEIKLYGLLF